MRNKDRMSLIPQPYLLPPALDTLPHCARPGDRNEGQHPMPEQMQQQFFSIPELWEGGAL